MRLDKMIHPVNTTKASFWGLSCDAPDFPPLPLVPPTPTPTPTPAPPSAVFVCLLLVSVVLENALQLSSDSDPVHVVLGWLVIVSCLGMTALLVSTTCGYSDVCAGFWYCVLLAEKPPCVRTSVTRHACDSFIFRLVAR